VSGGAKAGAASLWRSVRVVAWSFLGIRKGSESQEDMARVNPLHIIGVGIAAAALFVVSLVILVNWVVAK
jgi:hypothetical protein